MNANINYIGILNMLRYLEENGAITKAERKKIAEHIAIKKQGQILLFFLIERCSYSIELVVLYIAEKGDENHVEQAESNR